MKKSLFAIAAVTAFAGAAQAQSSVTVYGILDVGYIGGNARAQTARATNGAQDVNSETFSQLGQSASTNSRLGFRGTEDLGGGLSAQFVFETGLAPQSSTLSGFNNRQAFVGLTKKGTGNARIGTQYTVIHDVMNATSANGLNNIVGDVIYPQNTGITNRDGSASNAGLGYTVRANNMIRLESENMAGFKGTAFYALNNRNENQSTLAATGSGYTGGSGYSGGNTNSTGYGVGLNYNWKKLLLTANYQSFTTESAWTDRDALSVVGTTPGAGQAVTTVSTATFAGAATNLKDNQMYFAGAYDFGILQAYAQYIDRKVTSGLDSNAYVKRSAQQIGIKSSLTPKVQVFASVGNGRIAAFGSSAPTEGFTGYQLGTNYSLSKRTTLYGIFGATNTSTVTVPVTGTTTNTTVNRQFNANANNYAVGVRHTF
jgi:predicted porin